MGHDAFLEALKDKIPFLQVFFRRACTGPLAAKGDPVRAQTAEDYIRSVAQTFLELGKEDLRLNSAHNIDFRLQRMLSSVYKKKDPPPHRVKPVPVSVLRRIIVIVTASDDAEIAATANMIALGFFFLLRPGEYCISSGATDSDPFLIQDTALFQGERKLDYNTCTDSELLAATFGTLKFTTQKNLVCGEVVGQAPCGDLLLCPCRALARRIIHL